MNCEDFLFKFEKLKLALCFDKKYLDGSILSLEQRSHITATPGRSFGTSRFYEARAKPRGAFKRTVSRELPGFAGVETYRFSVSTIHFSRTQVTHIKKLTNNAVNMRFIEKFSLFELRTETLFFAIIYPLIFNDIIIPQQGLYL